MEPPEDAGVQWARRHTVPLLTETGVVMEEVGRVVERHFSREEDRSV
jgi:hypothetical protein